ncbi:MAG: UdgX family uracil-DNA binding protein [Sphingomonadaceae bacterium]
MHGVALASEEDFEGWRKAARALAFAGVPPEAVSWRVAGDADDLFAAAEPPPPAAETPAFSVPRAFLTLAETVIGHSDPGRFALLYALLVRLRDNPRLFDEGGDALVQRLEAMAREVRRTKGERPVKGDNIEAAWAALKEEAKGCTRCHLYKHATQTVFGEGPLEAKIMFVGEQPGDQEDIAGRPFVGPAGQLFDRALGDAGVDRSAAYVTNAVKHFKFVPRGQRRIHQKPNAAEIEACRWWVEQERMLLRPSVTVALGATAARSLFGKAMAIGRNRGQPHSLPDEEGEAWITVHPSYLLRVPDERKEAEYSGFVEDLVRIKARAEALAD